MARKKTPTEIAELNGMAATKPGRYKNRGTSKNCVKIHAEKPQFITQETSDAWDAVVPALENLKILSVQDLPTIRVMFQHYEKYTEMKHELDILDTESPRREKWYDERKKVATMMSLHWNDFLRISGRFGLTPADRANLVIPEQTDEDPLAVVLGE